METKNIWCLKTQLVLQIDLRVSAINKLPYFGFKRISGYSIIVHVLGFK